MTAPTTFEIGSTLVGIATLDSLTIPLPEAQFVNYSSSSVIGDGRIRGNGYPQAIWHYGYLKEAKYDLLIAFCSTASAFVYFSTLTNGNSYARYYGIMIPPDRYVIRSGRYVDVTFTFTGLVAQ